MDISIIKKEIEYRLNAYTKQINAYNHMLEKFCCNNQFHEKCGNDELNITRDGGVEDKGYMHYKAGDGHIGSCPFMTSLKMYQERHKDMLVYETDAGPCRTPMRNREMKEI